MISPNPILGTGLHAIGGISAASCYLPFEKTNKWSWGSFWIVQANFAWVIVPLILALITVPDLFSCFKVFLGGQDSAMVQELLQGRHVIFQNNPSLVIILPILLGGLYGFGGMSFGFAIKHIGYSMTYTLAIGISSIVGFMVPLMLNGAIVEFFSGTGGGTLLIGIFLSLTGILLCGRAGYMKERFLKASDGNQKFNMKRGLALTIFAGILSGIFGVGLEMAQPVSDVAAMNGAGIFEGNARILLPSIGCYITNIIWFVVAGIRNKSIRELNPKNSKSGKAYTKNFMLSVLGGCLWYIQFFFYGVGHVRMGLFKPASWVIHMSMLIFFSFIIGIMMKEWRNMKQPIIIALLLGLLVLIGSFVVMSIGSLQAEGGF